MHVKLDLDLGHWGLLGVNESTLKMRTTQFFSSGVILFHSYWKEANKSHFNSGMDGVTLLRQLLFCIMVFLC